MSDTLAFLIGCGIGFIVWAILAFAFLLFVHAANRRRDPNDLSDETSNIEATSKGFKATQAGRQDTDAKPPARPKK